MASIISGFHFSHGKRNAHWPENLSVRRPHGTCMTWSGAASLGLGDTLGAASSGVSSCPDYPGFELHHAMPHQTSLILALRFSAASRSIVRRHRTQILAKKSRRVSRIINNISQCELSSRSGLESGPGKRKRGPILPRKPQFSALRLSSVWGEISFHLTAGLPCVPAKL